LGVISTRSLSPDELNAQASSIGVILIVTFLPETHGSWSFSYNEWLTTRSLSRLWDAHNHAFVHRVIGAQTCGRGRPASPRAWVNFTGVRAEISTPFLY
jgi:hypothetical protein